MNNKSNIFCPLENKSILAPRRKPSQEKIVRIRLPSIQRKNSANES